MRKGCAIAGQLTNGAVMHVSVDYIYVTVHAKADHKSAVSGGFRKYIASYTFVTNLKWIACAIFMTGLHTIVYTHIHGHIIIFARSK